MLEREVIQSIGFRNTVEDGKVTGFQFRVRIPYYRGIFLCQLRPGSLIIDGKKIEKEEILWNVGGKDRTAEEMVSDTVTHWATTEAATIKVKMDGGLAQGFHDLTYGFCFTSSYMPPIMQKEMDPDKEPPFIMPEFGHITNFLGAVALDGVTIIYGRHLQITSAIYNGGAL